MAYSTWIIFLSNDFAQDGKGMATAAVRARRNALRFFSRPIKKLRFRITGGGRPCSRPMRSFILARNSSRASADSLPPRRRCSITSIASSTMSSRLRRTAGSRIGSTPPVNVDDLVWRRALHKLLDVLGPALERAAHFRDERMLLINADDAREGAASVR